MYDFLFFFRDFYFIFLSTIGLFQRDFDSKIMLFFIGVISLASI